MKKISYPKLLLLTTILFIISIFLKSVLLKQTPIVPEFNADQYLSTVAKDPFVLITPSPNQYDINEKEYPTLTLPMKYFDYKYLTSYSSCEGESMPKNPNCYKIASAGHFKGPYAYQSYPSTEITIKDYKNYDKQKPLTLNEVIKKANGLRVGNEEDGWEIASDAYIREVFNRFGPIIGNFMPTEATGNVIYTDVTGDGIKEAIAFTCPYGYAGSSCGSVWISDTNGNLLFSDFDTAIDLEPSEDGNGFFLYNVHPDDSEAFCCERMKFKVRFVYEDNKFIPIFQQVVVELKNEPEDLSSEYQYAKVIYYAGLKRFSTSGDMRFYWYDTDKKQRVDSDNEYSWFFALPTKVPYDEKATDDWVKYIEKNKTAVFKITGTREPDDCGYYGQDHCIQSINIDTIEIVK